jgi:uncharacterized membrane protein YheB (UPF0754 family)
MIGLPLVLAIATLLRWFTVPTPLIEAFYIVSLTANIGYFTNYVAIKMLFRPHHKTAFGRQGLIPKNQDKLANSLAQTLIENFLSKEQWEEYLLHSDLVNKVIAEARDSSNHWLSKQKNVDKLNQYLSSYLRANETAINQTLNRFQKQMVSQLSANVDINQLLNQGFAWLDQQFENEPEKMQAMIEPIIRTVAENIPDIARELVRALDDHIEDQDTIKRGIAKMARWSADFSEEDIKRYLFRMVASFEFRQTLFSGLQSLLKEYKEKSIFDGSSDDQSTGPLIGDFSIQKVISQIADSQLSDVNWVSMMINEFLTQKENKDESQTSENSLSEQEPELTLTKESNEVQGPNITSQDKQKDNAFSNILLSIHAAVFDKVESEMADGPLHHWIIDELISMIEKLDLQEMVKRKAAAFSPKKMEHVFQTMISEQLVFIELLGAVLGALSGLALVDIRLFATLAGLLASFYFTDLWLTRLNVKKSNTHLSES